MKAMESIPEASRRGLLGYDKVWPAFSYSLLSAAANLFHLKHHSHLLGLARYTHLPRKILPLITEMSCITIQALQWSISKYICFPHAATPWLNPPTTLSRASLLSLISTFIFITDHRQHAVLFTLYIVGLRRASRGCSDRLVSD